MAAALSPGRRLLSDGAATHPNGRLKHGVLAGLVEGSKAGGYNISETEIKYRMQAARTYESEAEVANVVGLFRTWHDLIQASFPPVELPDGTDPGDPYDPRDADEKWRDFRAQEERRKAENPEQLTFELPQMAGHCRAEPSRRRSPRHPGICASWPPSRGPLHPPSWRSRRAWPRSASHGRRAWRTRPTQAAPQPARAAPLRPGRLTGQSGKGAMWVGKSAMLGSAWHAVKYLREEG